MASYWDRVTNERIGRRRLLKAGAAFSTGVAALAVVGCGDDDDDDSGASSSGDSGGGGGSSGEPKQGGKFIFSFTQGPANFNVINDWQEGHRYSAQHVYDHLMSVRLGEKAPYILEAAESLEQPDDLTYVFTLQGGLVFQDIAPVSGRAVKAQDMVAIQNYIKTAPGANNGFQNFILDSIEATDERTIVFKLKAPSAYALTGTQIGETANQSLVPEDLLDNLAEHRPIGSGPYVLESWTIGSSYVWKRNPTFRRANEKLPYIDERSFIQLGDFTAQEAAFRDGQIHWLEPTPAQFAKLSSDLSNVAYPISYPNIGTFTVNIGGMASYNKLKADVRAREAFYRALDRQQFIDIVFSGKGTLPQGILLPALVPWSLDESEAPKVWSRDLTKARQLLEAAGVLGETWEANTHGGTIEGTAGQAALVLQAQMKEVGLNISVVPLTIPEGLERAQSGKWHFYVGGHPPYDSPQIIMRQLHSDSRSQFAWTGHEDSELDAMIEKAEVASDVDENIRLVKEIQKYALDHFSPYMPLVQRLNEQLLNSQVKDYEIEPIWTTALAREEMWIDPDA